MSRTVTLLLVTAFASCSLINVETSDTESSDQLAGSVVQQETTEASEEVKSVSLNESAEDSRSSEISAASTRQSPGDRQTNVQDKSSELAWQRQFQLANQYLSDNNQKQALQYAIRAEVLSRSLKNQTYRYASLIQLSRLTADDAVFERAVKQARTLEEKALALVILKRSAQLERQLSSLDSKNQPYAVAFIYHHYAEQNANFNAAKAAVGHYRQAESVYGVVDSLFLAAQLSKDSDAAQQFAERALRVAGYLPEQQRQRQIAAWLRERK